MNKLSLRSSVTTTNSLLDESSSQISSSFTQRLTRKPNELSNSRRSLSRKSSEKSQDSVDLSKFYVKMAAGKEPAEDLKARNGILARPEENPRDRKRCPTPVPGYNGRKALDRGDNSHQRQSEMENDLALADLQKKYGEEREKREIFEKRNGVFEKELRQKLKKIQDLEKELADSNRREWEAVMKLKDIQEMAERSECNLTETKSKLQKLKRAIKQNRTNQLELENAKLRRQNENLRLQIDSLQASNAALSQSLQSSQIEANHLRELTTKLSRQDYIASKQREIQTLTQLLSLSRSEREETLEQILARKEEEEFQLKLRIDKLEIKINFLNRKKNEEMEGLREKKNQELAGVRSRLAMVSKQLNELKKESEKLRRKNSLFLSFQGESRRNTALDLVVHDEHVSLDLSPEHFEL